MTAPSAHQQTFLAVASAVIVTVGSALLLAWAFIAGVQFESVGDIIEAQYRLARYVYATSDSEAEARETLRASGIELRNDAPQMSAQLSPVRITAHRVANRVEAQLGVPVAALRDADNRVVFWIGPGAELGNDWLALPLAYDPGNTLFLVMLWLAGLATTVILASWWLAVQINRPLQRLAAATHLLAEGRPLPSLKSEGPREVRRLGEALSDTDAKLRADLNERRLLLAGISHDLRTPLARLQLSADLLHGDEETRQAIEQDIAEINQILDRFLDFVRDGREEKFARVDLGLLLHEGTQRYRALAPIEIDVPKRLEVNCRPHSLQRLLHNLLDNAVRHGAAPISLRARRLAGHVVIEIRDHGGGLSVDARRHLSQAPNLAQAGRHGLGLFNVRRIAEAHGGRAEFIDARPGLLVRFVWPQASSP